MVRWIVLATVVSALVILVLVILPVLRRLPRFVKAAATLQHRQTQLLVLQRAAERLQEQALLLEEQTGTTQRRLGAIAARRAALVDTSPTRPVRKSRRRT